ncbi:MAG: FixH family protein [Flavobacteriales bacterium]|nr:FixH family protein [Flavobacteriales bacterium]
MSWGNGITVAIVLFISFILYFVFRMINHDVDLVAEDYYAQELAYQDQIHKIQNAEQRGVTTKVIMLNDSLKIEFDNVEGFENGELTMYRPSNPSKDLKVPLILRDKAFTLATKDLNTGKYVAKLNFDLQGTPCYAENIVVIP